MRPPPSSITRLTGFVCTPILWKNFAASFGLATTLMRSPASRVKLPVGDVHLVLPALHNAHKRAGLQAAEVRELHAVEYGAGVDAHLVQLHAAL